MKPGFSEPKPGFDELTTMHPSQPSRTTVWSIQALCLIVALASWRFGLASPAAKRPAEYLPIPYRPVREIPRTTPLVISPLYDDVEVVGDDDLAAVLAKIRPVFPPERLKPNYVEHALRTWSIHAKFADPRALSGEELKDFLTDHGKYLASWGERIKPLLEPRRDGVAVRWGKEECASIHHDHWLACLTEAGVSLDEPVFIAGRKPQTIADVLEQALSDFRLDDVEVEWSALAFGLWIVPQKSWTTRSGREISFDLIAERLMRGHKKFGTCAGTHRVYSLMALVRLDDEYSILPASCREEVLNHLREVRDLIAASQFPDGHWPSNWALGAVAVEQPIEDELFKQVIATGHHLEWLAIAPEELHPPREQILKAARWAIETTMNQTAEDIAERYTFFSHVGNALALWRKSHPHDFWAAYFSNRPEPPIDEPN